MSLGSQTIRIPGIETTVSVVSGVIEIVLQNMTVSGAIDEGYPSRLFERRYGLCFESGKGLPFLELLIARSCVFPNLPGADCVYACHMLAIASMFP